MMMRAVAEVTKSRCERKKIYDLEPEPVPVELLATQSPSTQCSRVSYTEVHREGKNEQTDDEKEKRQRKKTDDRRETLDGRIARASGERSVTTQ